MANTTVKGAIAIHGQNPQASICGIRFLVETVIRNWIWESNYWKEHCFALTARISRLVLLAATSKMTGLRSLITICGTTGVGKSKLAIELALKLAQGTHSHGWKGARIINADSMQVYTGMDVITIKSQSPKGYAWHGMDMVPIIVGGTSYWIQHLIFPNRLPTPSQSSSDSVARSIANLPPDLFELFNALPEQSPSAASHPQDAMLLHKLLTALDEPVAQRWHWKDTPKVIGSLRVIKDTGRTSSEVIAEYQTLCFWLYAEPSILNERLDARVDDMIKVGKFLTGWLHTHTVVQQGLLDEIKELRAIASFPTHSLPDALVGKPSDESAVQKANYTLGLYQSIGYKEFHDYFASPKPSEKLFASAVEQMKSGTRQYAKRQIRW
ncbi:hypothetical protein M405DRAFT_885555, partial [Rhizopogon salebrosus TDB-379]